MPSNYLSEHLAEAAGREAAGREAAGREAALAAAATRNAVGGGVFGDLPRAREKVDTAVLYSSDGVASEDEGVPLSLASLTVPADVEDAS